MKMNSTIKENRKRSDCNKKKSGNGNACGLCKILKTMIKYGQCKLYPTITNVIKVFSYRIVPFILVTLLQKKVLCVIL